MKLSLKAIAELKEIYQSKFNTELTDEEANTKGVELLTLFQYLSKPIPKEDESYFLSLAEQYGASNQAMYN